MVESTQVWKPIPGWEGLYEASDHGLIRSHDRTVHDVLGRTRRVKGRILTNRPHKTLGYVMVVLSRDGVYHREFAHRLVARAFLGKPEPGHEVRHLDGNRTNNHVSNLAWGTRAENVNDAVTHGTHVSVLRTRMTHCKHGHEFTPENTYRRKDGTRDCRKCIKIRSVRRQRAQAA
jgi:hypothetical protein